MFLIVVYILSRAASISVMKTPAQKVFKSHSPMADDIMKGIEVHPLPSKAVGSKKSMHEWIKQRIVVTFRVISM